MYAATMRVTPVQRGSVQGLTAHNARTEEYARKSSHIDPERVKDNRVLVGTSDPATDLLNAINGVAMARKGKREAEEYVGAEMILTAKTEYFQNLAPSDFEKWTAANLAWLRQEFDQAGRGRLVSAVLHLDEEAPHIHAVIAPVVTKSRTHPVTKKPMQAKDVLNYSAIFGDRPEVLAKARKEGRSHLDTQLGRLQTRYAQAMEPCGLVRGRESARTKTPDMKYVAPHLYRQIKEQKDALEQETTQAKEVLEQAKTEIQATLERYNSFTDGPRIKSEDAYAKTLQKGGLFKKEVTENVQQFVDRLNKEFVEPATTAARVAQNQLHDLKQKLPRLEIAAKKYEDLTKRLLPSELEKLMGIADSIRQEKDRAHELEKTQKRGGISR